MINKIVPKLLGTYLNTMALVSPTKVGKIGFNIFCTPIAPPVKPHHKEYLSTSSQFKFQSNGIELQAYRWGGGPRKILFLHGWQSHSFRWKKYIESFSKEEFTLYAFDAPAHGLSDGKYANIPLYSDAIRSFLEQVGSIELAITHSMGSFSAMHALHHHNHLTIDKLILMGSPGEANDFIDFYKKLTGMSDRTFKYIIDHFVKELRQGPEYFSAPRFASTLNIPGLIIHDEADDEAPYHHALRIHQAWPTSHLITTRGFGHNLRSHKVIDLVKEFVHSGSLQQEVLIH